MSLNQSGWLRQSRTYLSHLAITFLAWSLVPAFAKLGELDGLQKTFWINLMAIPVLIAIIYVAGKRGRKRYPPLGKRDIANMALLGLVFPFGYSILYFQAIYIGSPSLTTIIGRMSILVYAPLVSHLTKKRFSGIDIAMMIISIVAVAIAMSGSVVNETIPLISIIFAAVGSVATGIYKSVGESWSERYDPLTVVLVTEIVTVLGSVTWLLATSSLILPSPTTFFYLLYIGGVANGIGFWLFLEGLQVAGRQPDVSHKTTYLVILTGVLTFAQIGVAWFLGAEKPTLSMWFGSLILLAGFAWYHSIKQSRTIKA